MIVGVVGMRGGLMKILHSDDPPFLEATEDSIFLVGPTPRVDYIRSWRPDALKILEELKFEGTVLVPERKDWKTKFNYGDQIEWEYAGLSNATIIAVWVPRDIRDMPAFTTNVEFGYWLAKRPDVVKYGRPQNAPHTGYLDWLYDKITKKKPYDSLESLLKNNLR